MSLCQTCKEAGLTTCALQESWNSADTKFRRALAKVRGGWSQRNSAHSHADITHDAIAELRAQRAEGAVKYRSLASQFGCTKLTISDIAE